MRLRRFTKRGSELSALDFSWTRLDIFRAFLDAGRLANAARMLDEVGETHGLFVLQDMALATDINDPVIVSFSSAKIAITIVRHSIRMHSEIQSHRLMVLVPLLLACRAAGARGTVTIGLQDHGNACDVAFCSAAPNEQLIADHDFLATRAYANFAQMLVQHPVVWNDRIQKAFWRGSTTGIFENNEWRDLPRIALCRKAAANPNLFDASLTVIVQIEDEGADAELRAANLMCAYTPLEAITRFRYQIDIDGNTNAWASMFTKLLSGSPVLKVVSPYRQWYYRRLKPFVHFVPVASDMSDLVEKIEWLRANDSVAKKIGAKGRALALTLTYEREFKRSRDIILRALQPAAS